jgi:hypothetical protein
MMKILLSFLVLIQFATLTFAQVSADYAVLVTASIDESVPSITLKWPHDSLAVSYIVYKKSKASTSWDETLANLSGTDSVYTDMDIVKDSAYEYQVEKGTALLTAYGYIYSGINYHPAENRGKVILLIDSSMVDSLAIELDRLMKDISGDGWAIIRHDVARNDSVTHVKSLILEDYLADPEKVRAVFIFGHVPVPYSGDLNPDGHPDHKGAWPADIFYGDMAGNFTDIYVNDPGASRPENQNIPGDGKYDQSIIPGQVELQVGRVDLSNLPSFSLTETQLLKRYLDKDHNFRTKSFTAEPRGLINDNFGAFGGEAFASSGWRNFSPLIGSDSIKEKPFFATLSKDSYLWSYACGGGWYQGASGVGTTTDFANDTVKSVFTMLFGSYFGDWDSQDNFLRAPLASAGHALTSCWAGRPHWQFHHMGMGENIGYCARLAQNNNSTYFYNYGRHFVHIALMGDPTLKMQVVAPVTDVEATTLYSRSVINWQPSTDSVLGYYVYRSSEEFGEYSRVTPEIIPGLTYTDTEPGGGLNYYMVRAIKLEKNTSGSYYNLSTGITDSVSVILGNRELVMGSGISMTLFPNPAKDKVFLKLNEEVTGPALVTITDMTGKELSYKNLPYIHKNTPYPLNLEKIETGFYFISFKTQHYTLVRKLEVGRSTP